MKRVEVSTYTAAIYVGGHLPTGIFHAKRFCDEIGLCVTVEPVDYIYTRGSTSGMRVGLINYGRFPASPDEIFAKAEALALRLIEALGQDSASIIATDRTVWLSKRAEDVIPLTPLQETAR
jgi:hypothetical protein